jgi:type II secretory pathway component GspD/PulD (secretin)
VTTQVTPVFEGGSQGKPIPVTQFLQAPDLKTEKAEREVVIPSGGTVVLGGWKEAAEKPRPAAGKIPYLPRPVKNAPTEFEVVVLATTRMVRTPEVAAAPVAPMPREAPAPGDNRVILCKLRHVAAADAVKAVGEYLEAQKQHATLTAEPVSNTVRVSAQEAVAHQVLKLLDALDREPVQVMVQATVVEVPRGFCGRAGLEGDANAWTLSPREVAMFNALLRAAKEKGGIEFLARPQLQVNDGQTGFVQVGQDLPVVTPAVLPAGGAAQAAKVAYVPVGVTLRVTPKVTPDGSVLLDAQIETGEVSAAGVKTRSIRFNANVPSGQTLVFACSKRGGSLTGAMRNLCAGDECETLIILTPHCVRK